MTLQHLDRQAHQVTGEDAMIARIRFAVLWLVGGGALAGAMVVFFYEPGVLEEGVAGVMEGETVTEGMALLNAVMVGLPLLMAAVVLFLPGRAGAIVNLVVAVPLGAFGLFAIVSHLADGEWPAHLTLAALATAMAWLIAALSIPGLRHTHADAAAVGTPAQGTG